MESNFRTAGSASLSQGWRAPACPTLTWEERMKDVEKEPVPVGEAWIEPIIQDWIRRRIEFENPDNPNSWFRLRPEEERPKP